MALVRRSTLVESLALEGWSLARSNAERVEDVSGWLPVAPPPITVAAALRGLGRWALGDAFEEEGWWMRARLPSIDRTARNELSLGGLATLADVYLDGRHVLRSENMFHAHRLELPEGAAELAIRFSPVTEALKVKRPRPRWKTRLASHQQLRWIRTSLVGRMPGWSPPVPPIGPWRGVTLARARAFAPSKLEVSARLSSSGAGVVSVVLWLARAPAATGVSVEDAFLVVGDERAPMSRIEGEAGELLLTSKVSIPSPALWWPHTHGAPARYPARVTFSLGDEKHEIDLGAVAFRTVRFDTSGGRFAVVVNDVPVFCRGASWTTTDVATLGGTSDDYARVLGRVKDAGMNMLRLSGTMFYETDAFYELCDELGILVWQDFMFANMDYPIDDEAFRASVVREARELLARLQGRPCLAVLCGGSEVEQQAAMFGAAREIWRGPLFDDVLPDACAAICPDVPYWPNSPSGGALPFHVDEGVSHYYGVGAYLRPFDDARRARVKFATECLAFANVPEDDLFPSILREGEAPFVSARWKERTSKDHGSSWDFEDVRDHYLSRLFGDESVRVRWTDMDRYLHLSRVTSGEAMARVFAELRRSGSTCMGGLVWFLQDLWPGAGWGVLDARGLPKAPYWFLRRALQPLGLFVTDEGVNGLHVHVVNDRSDALEATLRVALYKGGEARIGHGERVVKVPPRAAIEVAADALLPTFADTAYAYRFGPPGHDLAVATLVVGEEAIGEAIHVRDLGNVPACAGIEARIEREGERVSVRVKSRTFAHAVAIAAPGFVARDNYFDLAPGGERLVGLDSSTSTSAVRKVRGTIAALNLSRTLALTEGD